MVAAEPYRRLMGPSAKAGPRRADRCLGREQAATIGALLRP
jgi:hypothetical protein